MSDVSGPRSDDETVVIDGVGGREPWAPAGVFALIGVPLIAVFTALATWWGIDHIEDQLEAEARADFGANGLDPDDFEIDFDYRDGDAWGPLPVGVTEREAEGYVDHRLLYDFEVHATNTAVDEAAEPEADDPVEDEVVFVSTDVEVELADGMIVLRGTVPTEAHRQVLLDAAAEVVGAANVIDELTVVAGEPTQGADARVAALAEALASAGAADTLSFALSDDSLDVRGSIRGVDAEAVLRRAVARAELDGSVDVDVVALGSAEVDAVYDGEIITLTGTVLSEAQRQELIAAAEAVVGAGNVVDELVVIDAEARVDGADARVAEMARAIASFADAEAGSAVLTDNGVEVTLGQPLADEAEIDELQAELDELAAEIRETVVFATGSDVLDAGATATLDKVVEAMDQHPLPVVEVSGHTDSTGDPDANRALSAARAQSVVDYLVAQGIDAARLQSRGAGADEPIADNATDEGRAQNRRVELTAAAAFVAG